MKTLSFIFFANFSLFIYAYFFNRHGSLLLKNFCCGLKRSYFGLKPQTKNYYYYYYYCYYYYKPTVQLFPFLYIFDFCFFCAKMWALGCTAVAPFYNMLGCAAVALFYVRLLLLLLLLFSLLISSSSSSSSSLGAHYTSPFWHFAAGKNSLL